MDNTPENIELELAGDLLSLTQFTVAYLKVWEQEEKAVKVLSWI